MYPLAKNSQNWHAMTPAEVLRILEVDAHGVSETELPKRRALYGENIFTPPVPPSVFKVVLTQVRSPLALVLLGAFVLTLALEEFIDAVVIGIALCIAVTISVFQEGKASRAFAALSSSQKTNATVFRQGKRHEVSTEDVVVGDIVFLQAGMQVPADVRLIDTTALSSNEAALTGEWLPRRKHIQKSAPGAPLAERAAMVYKGTFIAEGLGKGVVVAVGDNTEVGKIASELHTIGDEETPIQREMKKVSVVLIYIVVALVLAIFVLGISYGQSLHTMLLMAIAIAVASIPEGLPAAITIILAISMESLLKRGGLVKNLLAAETLGSTTYILTDKTGTLTEAKMQLTKVLYGGKIINDFATPNTISLLETSLLAIDAYADETSEGVVLRGDPVETSILAVARELNIDHILEGRTDYVAFTSENRFAAGVMPLRGKEFKIGVNGAPEVLLEHATKIHTPEGVKKLTTTIRSQFLAEINKATEKGYRLIAVAYKQTDSARLVNGKVLDDLVFFGVLVLSDPVRTDVAGVVSQVQAAGVEIRLVTGDNPATALTIASEVGITKIGDGALTGTDIENLSDDELLQALRTVKVFARVLPAQKKRLAEVLQRAGEIVAMTGDGVNDGPALQKANIGVAVGSGTMVAKESADLILVNDSFATIYAAIEEGRRVVTNIRKIIGYLLSTSLGEVIIIGSALLVGAASPLTPVQILWANIIEEGLMGVAFAFEKGEKGAMNRRPQDIHKEGVFSKAMIAFLVLVTVVVGAIAVGVYFYLRSLAVSEEIITSVMFLLISVDSLFMAFAFRSLTVPVWRISLFENRFFIGSFVVTACLLTLVLSVPFLQDILSYQPLSAFYIYLVIAASVLGLVAVEVAKALYFEKNHHR